MAGGPYDNSGLARFGVSPYQGYRPGMLGGFQQQYTPAIFQAPQTRPMARPTFPVGGMFGGAQTPAPAGGAGGSVGDPSTNAVSSTATDGTLGQLGQLGLAAAMGPAALGIAAANMGMTANNAPPGVVGQAIGQTVGENAAIGAVGSSDSVGDTVGPAMGFGVGDAVGGQNADGSPAGSVGNQGEGGGSSGGGGGK